MISHDIHFVGVSTPKTKSFSGHKISSAMPELTRFTKKNMWAIFLDNPGMHLEYKIIWILLINGKKSFGVT